MTPKRGCRRATLDKINVYVPENIGHMLESDASMFEVYKKDGRTINKNRFLGMLITGYYGDYVTESRSAYDRIVSSIDTEKLSVKEREQIADHILRSVVLPTVPSRKGKNPARLSLKPTKDTEPLIERIMFDMGGEDFVSQYFCRMFMSYCEKPFSKREQIIFKNAFETLKNACDTGRSISFKTIWNTKNIHEVIPYKVITGPEEMFNYLLCAEVNPSTGKQEAKTFRLNRIDRINYGRSMSSIDNTVQHYLDMMLQYGPQYMINDEEETCVRLNEAGLRNYNRIYYGRPFVERIEDKCGYSYLYFKCSKDQVYLYFRRFSGAEALIISPSWLKEKMARFHQESVEAYEEGDRS